MAKKPKIIVWLDVDDVLLDFKGKYNRHLRENYNINIKDSYIPLNWNYGEVLPPKVLFKQTMKTLGRFWAGEQKALSGAKQFTQTLKKMGVKVILITHIEGEQGPNRIETLIKEGLFFDEVYFTMGRSKSDFAKQIWKRYPGYINCFMDDKAENVIDFIHHVPQTKFGVTLKVPYNDKTFRQCQLSPPDHRLLWVKDYKAMYRAMLKFVKKTMGKNA